MISIIFNRPAFHWHSVLKLQHLPSIILHKINCLSCIGIRLIPIANPLGDPTKFIWAKDAHFIWQPDDYSGGMLSTAADGATTIDILGVDLWNGDAGTDPTTWDVQPGDYLEIGDGGLLRRIIAVPTKSSVLVTTPVPYKLEPTPNLRR